MTLQLRITKAPDGTTPTQTVHSIDGQGGTLGRGADNTLVLPDPERILSSRHCEFVRADSGYQVVDWSTNGTFINNSSEPLGKGSSAPLSHGDVIEVGDYCFSVEVEEPGASGVGSSPFADSALAGGDGFPDNDAASPSPVSSDDPFQSDPFGPLPGQPAVSGQEALDPLQLLDGAQSPPPGNDMPAASWEAPFESGPGFGAGNTDPGPFAEPAATGEPMADPGAEALDWPESRPENLIPDDWMEEPSTGGGEPLAGRGEPSAAWGESFAVREEPSAAWEEPSAVREKSSAVREKSSANFNEPSADWKEPSAAWEAPADSGVKRSPAPSTFGAPQPAPSTGPEPAEEMDPGAAPESVLPRNPSPAGTEQNSAVPPRVPRPGAKPDRKCQAAAATDSDALFAAMGFDTSRFSAEEKAELLPLVGKMMREVVEGMMQVLRSRASIKNEFRMNVTTIQPVENNPLKFSADVDEALDNIFVRRSQAYKEPLAAVREGFQEIAEHQLAVIAGMRSAFEHMLRDFDSERLEARFDQQGKRSAIPMARNARYWRQYQSYYRGLSDNIERSFQQIFGDEFVQAYQDQLRRLSSLRPS